MAASQSAWAPVSAWFVLNILIGNLNGWILRNGFNYPVLLTVVHMVCCWALAGVSLLTCMHPGGTARPVNHNMLRKVRTLSLAFCASVACGNIALQYIYVSFAQMVTAAGPLFTIALMYTMTGKRYSRAAYASMLPMCGGVMMCTAGEVNFHLLGFIAVVSATLLRGVKSILQGRLLTSPEEKLDSLTLLYHLSAASILPLGAYVALVEHAALHDPALTHGRGALVRWAMVVLSGFVAFFLNLCNFVVTKRTSAVTLQVSRRRKDGSPHLGRPLTPSVCLAQSGARQREGGALDRRLAAHLPERGRLLLRRRVYHHARRSIRVQ